MSLGACIKKLHLVKVGSFVFDTASKFALFSVSGLKDKKLIRKQTYTKTDAYKLLRHSVYNYMYNYIMHQ